MFVSWPAVKMRAEIVFSVDIGEQDNLLHRRDNNKQEKKHELNNIFI